MLRPNCKYEVVTFATNLIVCDKEQDELQFVTNIVTTCYSEVVNWSATNKACENIVLRLAMFLSARYVGIAK